MNYEDWLRTVPGEITARPPMEGGSLSPIAVRCGSRIVRISPINFVDDHAVPSGYQTSFTELSVR